MAKEYIDTEELLNTLEDYIEYNTFDIYQEEPLINMSFEQLEDIVTSQPTADVVEVVHGEWVRPSEFSQLICDQCRRTPKTNFGVLPNYCPNCGAKMDGKKVE